MRTVILEHGRLRVSDDPTGLIGYVLEVVRARHGGATPHAMFAPTGNGLVLTDQIGAVREAAAGAPDRWTIARWGMSSNAVTIAGDELRSLLAASAVAAYAGGTPPELLAFPLGATTGNGRYRATEHLAGSRFAGVYRGIDTTTDARVRITISTPQTRAYPELAGALAFAVDSIAPLLHIGALDVTCNGEAFDAMVEAEPDGTPATSERLDPRVAAQLVVDVLRRTQRAHTAGIAIGTLRPEVIYVDAHHRATGIAPRAERFFATRTRGDTNIACFDEPFAAPEVLNGGPPSPASDVFALATIAVCWLTGAPAFGNPYPIVLTTTRNAYTGPPVLADPLARALAIRAPDRSSLSELLDALEAYLARG